MAIHIEDHAVDRYIERVRKCHPREARAYLFVNAPRGARIKERTRAGNEQIRLEDCLLIMGPHRKGEAVVTVYGLGETRDEDEDDEMVELNRLADLSRKAQYEPVTLSPLSKPAPVPALAEETFVEPTTRHECEERRKRLLLDVLEIQEQLRKLPADFTPSRVRKPVTDRLNAINLELGKLRDWLKADNKRVEKEKARARKDKPPAPAPASGTAPAPAVKPPAPPLQPRPTIQSLEAKLREQKARHLAHHEHTEVDLETCRNALRVAIRRLMAAEDSEALLMISMIEPGFLVPEFYGDKK